MNAAEVFLNPYVLVLVSTLVTACIVTAYNRTLEDDDSKVSKAFYKIVVMGTVANLALVYFVQASKTTPAPALPAPDAAWP